MSSESVPLQNPIPADFSLPSSQHPPQLSETAGFATSGHSDVQLTARGEVAQISIEPIDLEPMPDCVKPGWLSSFSRQRATRLAIIVALIAVAIFIWDELFKYRFIAKRWGVVIPGEVYRSGQISKWKIADSLSTHNIQAVIDLSVDEGNEHQLREQEVVDTLGIEYFRYSLAGDGTGDIEMYAEAIAMLVACRDEGKPTLIHCSAGSQRTGGVIAAYRVLVEGRSAREAVAEMIDNGFRARKGQKLMDYLNANMARLTELLVERGVIASPPNPLPVMKL